MLSPRPASTLLRATTLLATALGITIGITAPTASCGGDDTGGTTGVSSGGSGGTGPASSSTTASSGGMGGGTTSSTGGGGGMVGCASDNDCTNDPAGLICDVATGKCVECLPADDMCATGQYCNPQNVCQVGCNDQSDCNADTTCDPATHQCVGCVIDTDCPSGSICISETCIPGCSGTQPCEAGSTCCSQKCYDLATDEDHCGTCSKVCDPALTPNAIPVCTNGLCLLGPCNPGFDDCDLDSINGCEQNTLQDGPCVCAPGDTQPCYSGSPGTEDVGLCKGGTSSCVEGTGWGPCQNQVIPAAELCNQLDDDCDGSIEPQPCEQCVPNTGSCIGQVGKACKDDGLGYVFETCDPILQNTTCNPTTGKCDGECGNAALGSSYIGCVYYPTVTANITTDTIFHFAVAVSNTGSTTASINVSQGAAQITTATVAPNSVQIINLPWVLPLKGPTAPPPNFPVQVFPSSVRVNDGAYKLVSNHPVTVYQYNPLEYTRNTSGAPCATNLDCCSPQICQAGTCSVGAACFSFTNDASLLLPVNVWTGQYRVAARHHFAGSSGFYAVTAQADNTTVTVAPGPTSGLVKTGVTGIGSNGSGTVTLNSGDVIQIVTNGSGTLDAVPDPNDVSGSLILADKPVQVIGGHQCIYIPFTVPACDHIEESMFPVETLSTTYMVAAPLIPTGGSTPKVEFIRIIATKPNTTLTYDPPQGAAPASITQAGGWVEIADNNQDFRITASEPVLVAQYMEGQQAGGNSGDPAMALTVAEDQYRSSYLFHAPTNYESSFISIVAPNGTVVTLDGAPVAGFTPIGATGLSVARTSLSNAGNGNHNVSAPNPFGINVYGYGQYTSYWYPGGLNLTKLHD